MKYKINIYRLPLTSLCLADSLIDSKAICKIITNPLSKITKIDISYMKLTDLEVESFCKEISQCTKITTLILKNMKV